MLTDLYQLTMAQGYWKLGKHQQRAVFDLFFREHPFGNGYTVCCGLEAVLQMIPNFCFSEEDTTYLSMLKGIDGKSLFAPDFLRVLRELRLSINMKAIPEGTLVFPKEPLLRVEGSLWECQLLETLLLNLINFPSLIATKAARICLVAEGDPVIEFGLRRAQGPNGALTASRAAYVGGITATSNVLAGEAYGIPLAGTHAHSWVLAFEDERQALASYAQVMPNNCILLVDTYNVMEGIRHAIEVGLELKKQGYPLLGIRLDAGDLAYLSKVARSLLDEAGLTHTKIVGSNDLDEYAILKLKKEGTQISLWGVGTRLATAYDQPALSGVYKLVALEVGEGKWHYKAKHTDDFKKQSLPGIHQVRRFSKDDYFVRDVIYNIADPIPLPRKQETVEELLVEVVNNGRVVYPSPPTSELRKRTIEQLKKLPAEIKTLDPIRKYPVLLQGPP